MGISYQSTLSLIQVLAQQSVLRTRSGIGTVSHDGIVQFLASNVQLILVLADTQWVIDEARSADHREMVGDTMPVMERALEMYGRAGFERTGPYSPDPTPGAIFLRLRLDQTRNRSSIST